MTLDEALAELGIDHDVGSDGARRAYLRLLKTRKPETDPAGFMRLREAYDLIKSDLQLFEAFRARIPAAPEPRAAYVEPQATEVEVQPVEVEVQPVDPEVQPVDPEVQPVDPEVQAVDLADPAPEPAGDELPPADAEAPVAEPDPGDVRLLETLLARSAYVEASEQALLILAAATRRFDTPDPPVLSCLRLMLGLHAVVAPKRARAVARAFSAWLASSGQEATRIRGQAAVLWTVVRELNSLEELPGNVRGAIARAALEGDLAEARPDLERFCGARRSAARAAGKKLRKQAPVLAAQLADTLDPPQRAAEPSVVERSQQRAEGSSKGLWFIPMLLLGLLRILLAVGRSTPSYSPYSNPLPAFTYTTPRPMPMMSFDAGILSSIEDLARQQAIMRARAVSYSAPPSGAIHRQAKTAITALEREDCGAALAAAAVMRAESVKNKKTIAPVLSADLVLFDASVHRYCDGHEDVGVAADVELDGGPGDAGRRGRTLE